MPKGTNQLPPNVVSVVPNVEGLTKVLQDILTRLTEIEKQVDAQQAKITQLENAAN